MKAHVMAEIMYNSTFAIMIQIKNRKLISKVLHCPNMTSTLEGELILSIIHSFAVHLNKTYVDDIL